MGEKKNGSGVPFYYNHVWKNVLLLALSVVTAPISLAAVFPSIAASKLHGHRTATFSKEDKNHRAAVQQRRTILVTGVSMTKGLTIARNLSQHTPHRIIGADISALSPGRFSSALAKYYRLDAPSGDDAEPYIDSILSIMRTEKVDLWISCSSVVAAVEDGQVVALAEQQAKAQGRHFHAIQFRSDVVEKFHEKDKFIDYIESLDLPVPESYRCTSPYEALDVLMRELHSSSPRALRKQSAKRYQGKKFIMKPIGVDDRARANMMTLLPFSTVDATTTYIRSLNISPSNPFQLQQFIRGKEYCTHALVVRGKVRTFTCCPSLELLMHYEALPAYSSLSQEMLRFTQRVCEDGGSEFSGHLSFDFFVEGAETGTGTAEDGDGGKVVRAGGGGGEVKLYPIESNPRAHTAVVLFEQTPEMADGYLSVFNNTNTTTNSNSKTDITSRRPSSSTPPPVFPRAPTYSYYWLGHDLVTFGILPVLDWLFGQISRQDVLNALWTLWTHVVYWKDGTFTLDDPWPFFALYHVYWPARFVEAVLRRKAWSR
ncbi:hypothetical protein N0V83_005083 [Neocucurbitaria cava]|uniref:ATP-grasp domain-containing protein n=1 Tax=Neocucurbitaria cava TaxID=798079 RepID=A0A9W8Y940_9PLEO|nr:hypothetical protein N0V83_005083 [Neocucurbitaria cava]